LTYVNEEELTLEEAWKRLAQEGWEIVERRDDGVIVVGAPVLKRSRTGGVGTVVGPGGEDGRTGVRVFSPGDELAGAWWLADSNAAHAQFHELLRNYSDERAGDERLFRVELLIEGEAADDRLIAVGEIVPAPHTLDSISLTYLAALTGLIATFGFGIGALAGVLPGVASGVVTGVLIAAMTRRPRSRKMLLRVASWGLGGGRR